MPDYTDEIIGLEGLQVIYCMDPGQPHQIARANRRLSPWWDLA